MEEEVLHAMNRKLDELVLNVAQLCNRMADLQRQLQQPHEMRGARACARKNAYTDRKHAQAAIKHMRKEGRRTAYRLRAYHCPVCNQWHLTKMEE